MRDRPGRVRQRRFCRRSPVAGGSEPFEGSASDVQAERFRQDTPGPGGVKLWAHMPVDKPRNPQRVPYLPRRGSGGEAACAPRDHVRGPQHVNTDHPAALTWTLAVVAFVGLLLGGCASAERKATDRMLELNRSALADLKKGRPADARKLLLEAERVGEEAGMTDGPVVARTHLALGSVYSASPRDRKKAVAHMSRALAADPAVRLGSTLGTPAARRALAAAKAERVAASKAGRAPEPPPPLVAREEKPARPEPPVREARPREEKQARVRRSPPPPREEAPARVETPSREEKQAEERLAQDRGDRGDRGDKGEAPAEERRPRADGEEPDLPANIPDDLYCPVPEQTPPDEPLTLRCVLRPGVRAGRLTLHYRPAGSETFTDVPMARSRKGWFRGVVPASAATGKSLQYYVEGSVAPKLTSGNSDSPNLVMVREGADPTTEATMAVAGHEADEPPTIEDENPLAEIEKERAREGVHVRAQRRLWAGLGLGRGWGWQGGGPLEFRQDQAVAAGMLAGGLGQLLPEVGYQWSERMAFSLQLRFQFLPTEGSGDPTPGKPAVKAIAALARATYAVGDGNLRGFGSLAVGGGDGFRLKVAPNRQTGLVRSDTIRGGPLLGGAGGGVIYHINPHVAWPTELRALAGFPDVAVSVELTTGLEVAF
jgi:hypothetical protein